MSVEREHLTDGTPCWCDPIIEDYSQSVTPEVEKRLRRALAWLIRYRDTTRIPPADIAETLYEPATQRAILRADEPFSPDGVTDIPIVEDDAEPSYVRDPGT